MCCTRLPGFCLLYRGGCPVLFRFSVPFFCQELEYTYSRVVPWRLWLPGEFCGRFSHHTCRILQAPREELCSPPNDLSRRCISKCTSRKCLAPCLRFHRLFPWSKREATASARDTELSCITRFPWDIRGCPRSTTSARRPATCEGSWCVKGKFFFVGRDQAPPLFQAHTRTVNAAICRSCCVGQTRVWWWCVLISRVF